MEGKMCRENIGHIMHMIICHKIKQKPKGKVCFHQNSFCLISSHNFSCFCCIFPSDWQRFRQGPLMVELRIKKIFIDNVSFLSVWLPQLIIQNANCKHNSSKRVTTECEWADCEQVADGAGVREAQQWTQDRCTIQRVTIWVSNCIWATVISLQPFKKPLGQLLKHRRNGRAFFVGILSMLAWEQGSTEAL